MTLKKADEILNFFEPYMFKVDAVDLAKIKANHCSIKNCTDYNYDMTIIFIKDPFVKGYFVEPEIVGWLYGEYDSVHEAIEQNPSDVYAELDRLGFIDDYYKYKRTIKYKQ